MEITRRKTVVKKEGKGLESLVYEEEEGEDKSGRSVEGCVRKGQMVQDEGGEEVEG